MTGEMMLKSKFARAAAMASGVAAMVVATASPAFATNKTVDIGYGYGTFIDDGDLFKVCDTQKDGKGVYGAVFYNSYFTTSGYKRVMTVSDGGDAGCDQKGYDIGNSGTYTFVVCWGFYPTSPFMTASMGYPCSHTGEFNE
ncbi:hypothetical protein NGF19_13545 [Streptomyces sp. RY43-2]|uniref:Secreted protein n=1 Tax=Streptomyces macrolidinus TaxID=2952607 RepID=A0ABT0ZE15_9ACTN|nr:hypothetical protein [Streptomyces macrolidinus]MCN9241803.1 hypothetical protein [Streptomyces macrolidinus]